jgi:plastocyanin
MIRLFAAFLGLAALAAQPTAAATPARLVATVGPGTTITLKKSSGAVVRSLRPGIYTITVRDRSRAHNFHLAGPTNTLSRSTTVGFVGTKTWRLRLVKGKYGYMCDPHATSMKGSFTVR